MKRIIQIFILFFYIVNHSFSNDTSTVNYYNSLFLKYEYSNADSAKYYNDKALTISKNIKYKEGFSDALLYRGYYYDDSGLTDSANYFLNQALEVAESINDSTRIATIYNNIGYLFSHTGDFDKALQNYITYLRIAEKLNDSTHICKAKLNIGNVHLNLKEYDESKKYYLPIENYFNRKNDFVRLGYVYNSLAIVYQYRSNPDLDSALFYYNKSKQSKYQSNDASGVALTISNIASLYYDIGDYNLSLKKYLEAVPLLENLNDVYNLTSAYKNTGMVYRILNDFKNSEIYLKKGLEMAFSMKSKFYISESYNELSTLYQLWKKPDQSLFNLRQHILYKDSILGEENVANIRELEALYEKDKKEREIEILNKENKIQSLEISKQNQLKLLFAIGFSLMLIIALIIFRSYKQKQKSNEIINEQKKILEETNEELNQSNEELAAQRDEIENQKNKVEEAHKEIKDSINYAKRIQEAILPSLTQIKRGLPNSFVYYQPKDVVAGDFYWQEKIGEKVYIAAADCTGHGVPGAMVSVVCSNALTKAVLEDGIKDVGKILDRTREIVIDKLAKSGEVKDGMDISLVCFDFRNMKLEWAGANNPLYLLRVGEIQMTKGDREPIGYTDNPSQFTKHIFDLLKGGTIYLFTDGYADQFGGPEGKKLGYKNFREKLVEISNLEMNNQKEELESYFKHWKGNEEQVDDVCIIGIRV